MAGPLSSLKVLDFSTLLPGPFGTMVLADLGAEVIRIESPSRPDMVRAMPPMVGRVSAAHAYLNRSKRSLAIDLKKPEGVALVKELVKDYDIIVDGCDNFPTRYLVNDACVFMNKPNVHGSIFQFEGQTTVFDPRSGPCYRCLFPEPPPPGAAPSCQEAGVLGVLPGLIGSVQAVETLKLILGIGTSLVGRLLHFDTLSMDIKTLKLRKDPECPVCGDQPTVTELIDYEEFCGLRGGGEAHA